LTNGNINKIIVITYYPFNKYDYNRFGIELLRNQGFEVEIWDITSCLNKNFKDELIIEDTQNFKNLRVFNENSEIFDAISHLDDGCIINCLIEYSLRTFYLFRAISKNKIRYCVFGMVSFPSPYQPQQSFIGRIVSLLKKGSALKFNEIVNHILNKILLKYYFLFGVAPASIILLGGEKSKGSSSYPINQKTIQLWTHASDYDIYLQHNTEFTGETGLNNSGKMIGVFLDEYLPLHPDCHYVGLKFPISPENYYPKICNFFECLEKNFNVEIIIAAHPKSDYSNLPDYFGGRTIIKGETGRLVRKSSFVITHMSTSINFAVLYHKPIFFITFDDLQKMVVGKYIPGLYIPAIASELGKTPINIDHLSGFNWKHEKEIDNDAYHQYRDNYIKKQGTPENQIWEIFSRYIQQNNCM
jgi:hypothetical protein